MTTISQTRKELEGIDFGQNSLGNIEIAYDTTDHFTFICPECKGDCKIKSTKTIKSMQIDFEGRKDNCTYFTIYCVKCKKVGQRKIYWDSEKHLGRSQRGRTNWKEYAKEQRNLGVSLAQKEFLEKFDKWIERVYDVDSHVERLVNEFKQSLEAKGK